MKKFLIISILISSVFFTGCGKESATEAKEVKPEHFDITTSEFVSALDENYLIDLDFIKVIDVTESEKIETYTFSTEKDTMETQMHYQMNYDDVTKNIYHILFMVDKDFMGDLESVYARFFYHVDAVASVISPTVDTDEINEALHGISEEMKIYNSDNFSIMATNSDDYITALFTPNKN